MTYKNVVITKEEAIANLDPRPRKSLLADFRKDAYYTELYEVLYRGKKGNITQVFEVLLNKKVVAQHFEIEAAVNTYNKLVGSH